jgi:hypothetical protein
VIRCYCCHESVTRDVMVAISRTTGLAETPVERLCVAERLTLWFVVWGKLAVPGLVWRNRCYLDKGVQTSRGGELQSGDYFITVARGKTARSPSLGLNGQGHPWTYGRTAYGSVICQYGNRASTTGKPQRTACLRLVGLVNTEGSAVIERLEKSSGCGPLRRFADP